MEEEQPNDQRLKDVLMGTHRIEEPPTEKLVIGAEEWCAFPELGVPAILARVDSGARTSSIHAFNIQPFEHKGKNWVSFEVHPLEKNRTVVVRCEAPIVDHRSVKSSSGVAEKRYVIQTRLRLWSQEFLIELTLANRDSMGYRMLLGREAMVGRVIVDPQLNQFLGQVDAKTLDRHYKTSRRSTDGLRIAILTDQDSRYTHKRIVEACEERGHFVSVIDLRKSFLTLKNESCALYETDQGVIQGYDCLLPRFSSQNASFGLAVLRQFEMLGGLVLHDADAVGLALDKPRLMQKMVEIDVPISASGFACDSQLLSSMVPRIGDSTSHVQLFDGFTVQNLVRANTRQELKTLTNAWKDKHQPVRVWQSGENGATRVIKSLVVGQKIIVSVKKDQYFGESRGDDRHTYEPYQLTKEEKKDVQKIAKMTGLNYLAIDLLQSGKEHVISDVHVAPAFERFENVTGKDIATPLVVYLEKICDWLSDRSNMMSEVSRGE